jgi:Arc/MetJ family transcription regulator
MATNLDIDLPAVETLRRLGGFRSKREAVDAAVREAIAYRQQLATLPALGTIDFVAVPGAAEAAPKAAAR